jgi:hypothetical protein
MILRRLLCVLIIVCISGLIAHVVPLAAQESTFLGLSADEVDLQTGQAYEIRIQLINAPEVWVLSAEIQYDPNVLYVPGTLAGSPVRQGDFFSPPDSTVIVRNAVESGTKIAYTISMLAPAESPSGSGLVGTFRIYPLAPGATRLTFTKAALTAITYDSEGNVETSSVPFTPALIDLNITGDPVDPPDEATATPTLTPTVTETIVVRPDNTTPEPTLINVTLDPNAMTPSVPVATEASGTSPLLIIAVVIMAISGIGAVSLIVLGIRRRR